MTPLPRLIMISGWAHDSSVMEELRKCLEDTADVSSISTGDLWNAESAAGFQSPYARNLVKMIAKPGGQTFIAGWSLGGMIALETASYRPDLVAGMILISSTAKFITGDNWTSDVPPGVLRAMSRKFKRDPRAVLETFFQNVALPFTETKETISLKFKKASAMNPLVLSAGLEYLFSADLRSVASKLNIPALIIHGKEDAIIPMEAGMGLKKPLPISEIRLYDNYGHGLPWQNPRAVAEDIKGFLKKCQDLNTKRVRP